jgi:HK97 family phage prohead protease
VESVAQYKSVDIGDEFDDEFSIIASTPDRDRYGDIVVQDWRLDDFKRNPVILWAHDSTRPVGRATHIAVEDKRRLVARLQLGPDGTSRDIDELRKLVKAKIIRAASVGFFPGKSEAVRDEDGIQTGFRFSQNTLFEISLVSVPANPQALAISRSLNISEDFSARLFAGADARPFLSRKQALLQLIRAQMRK